MEVVRGVVRRVVRVVVRRVVLGVVRRVVRGAGSVGSPQIGGQSFLLSRAPQLNRMLLHQISEVPLLIINWPPKITGKLENLQAHVNPISKV